MLCTDVPDPQTKEKVIKYTKIRQMQIGTDRKRYALQRMNWQWV